MTRVVIVTAIEREARILARRLGLVRVTGSPWLRFEAAGVDLFAAGVGAPLLEERLDTIEARGGLVVSAGVCGALAPDLDHAGALVLPRLVLDGHGRPLNIDDVAHGRATESARRAGLPVSTGMLITAPHVVETPEAKAALWRDSGAVAVDMESARVVRAAAGRGMPALVVRAVSDLAGQQVAGDLAALLDATGRVSAGRTAALIVRRPSIIPAALALQRGTRRALRSVGAVLAGLRPGTAFGQHVPASRG